MSRKVMVGVNYKKGMIRLSCGHMFRTYVTLLPRPGDILLCRHCDYAVVTVPEETESVRCQN